MRKFGTQAEIFDVGKPTLASLMEDVAAGRLMLPHFQREYLWPDDNIRSLIGSIIEGHPIGSAMFLEHGGSADFAFRPVEGAPMGLTPPERLILDGQQRITSIYQSCFAKAPVRLKGGGYRSYFLDCKRLFLTEDPVVDCIISVKTDASGAILGKVPDYTNREYQFRNTIFPLNEIFDSYDWTEKHDRFWYEEARTGGDGDRDSAMVLKRQLSESLCRTFGQCQISLLILKKATSAGGICDIYEKLNSKGIELDAFDILIAKHAAKGRNLHEEWYNKASGLKAMLTAADPELLGDLQPRHFMHTVNFLNRRLTRRPIEYTDKALMALEVSVLQEHKPAVLKAFGEVARFLKHECIYSKRLSPSPIVLMILTVVFARLGSRVSGYEMQVKLRQWLRTAMYKNYFYGNDKLVASALPELEAWLVDGTVVPAVIERLQITDTDIVDSSAKGSVQRALIASILRSDAVDFSTGHRISAHTYIENKNDEHHVFPKKWAKEQGIPPRLYDSIINKTPMSPLTNRQIGGRAPSEYLKLLAQKLNCSDEVIDAYVRTHGINPVHLRNDDFYAFYEDRKARLCKQVGDDTGHPVVMSDVSISETGDEDQAEAVILASWPESATWSLCSRKCKVFMRPDSDRFMIVAGSVMSPECSPSLYGGYVEARNELIRSGVVVEQNDGSFILVEDYAVSSISAASSIFSGYLKRGRWIDRSRQEVDPDFRQTPSEIEAEAGDVD